MYFLSRLTDVYLNSIFQAAADLVNEHVTYRDEHGLRLRLETFSTANKSSFHLSKMVCRALQTKGYHVLIGPSDPSLRFAQSLFCNAVICCPIKIYQDYPTVVCKIVHKIDLYGVKWPQEKQACDSLDDATPSPFQLQVTEDFF